MNIKFPSLKGSEISNLETFNLEDPQHLESTGKDPILPRFVEIESKKRCLHRMNAEVSDKYSYHETSA